MRSVNILVLIIISSLILSAQQPTKQDTIVPEKGNVGKQLKDIKEKKIRLHSDVPGNQPKVSKLIDTTIQNKYGDLLNDDTIFNRRYPVWKPGLEVLGALTVTWAFDRYILNADYARIGIKSWNYNLKKGWEWDNDRFGVNFVGHPYSGAISFNAGRANGYNYYQSALFAVGGSLIWEYFGENTRPSYNDIINTPVSGAFLGEVLYRLSSNILDDRTRGRERVFREIAAAIIDPKRGFDRLLQGKTFRITNKEVYQKEPLNVSIYAGMHKIDEESQGMFGKGTYSELLNIQLDYGNPFEIRKRKPYDFFRLRADLNFGVGRKILANVSGYGILFGKNMQLGNLAILAGVFQSYDYWDTKIFELGTIDFGGGVFTKLPLSHNSNLYTNVHLALVPFAGNSTKIINDSSQLRDYNFGSGIEGKIESTINLGNIATASLVYYYFIIKSYVGAQGYNFIGILKPRITVQISRNLSIGFEHFVYYDNTHLRNIKQLDLTRTEEKLFLLLYLQDPQRRGHYN